MLFSDYTPVRNKLKKGMPKKKKKEIKAPTVFTPAPRAVGGITTTHRGTKERGNWSERLSSSEAKCLSRDSGKGIWRERKRKENRGEWKICTDGMAVQALSETILIFFLNIYTYHKIYEHLKIMVSSDTVRDVSAQLLIVASYLFSCKVVKPYSTSLLT